MSFYAMTRDCIIWPLLPKYFHTDNDALAVFSRNSNGPISVDRFGYLNQFSKWDLYTEKTPFPSSNYTGTVEDIMDKRASEIMNILNRTDMNGYIFVSGGVDSTAMTYALLNAAGSDISKLHIIYTSASLEENPKFFEFLKTTGIDLVETPVNGISDTLEKVLEHSYAITGFAAGYFFDSILNDDFPDLYHKDWRPWVKDEVAIGQFEEAFSYYGMPIKTFAEFSWFTGFLIRYNHSIHLDVCYSGKVTNRCIGFYDVPELNDWSVSNFDTLHRHSDTETKYYKAELKDYIYKYNHDKEYRLYKGKKKSWKYKTTKYVLAKPRLIIMESPTSCISYIGENKLDFYERIRIYTLLYAQHSKKYRKDEI